MVQDRSGGKKEPRDNVILVGNVFDISLKFREVTYISSIFTKMSNVGRIWDSTSPHLCRLALIYVVMVRTSLTIHRINIYIRVSTSIACTNSTTPHDSSRGLFLLLFFFAVVAIANVFLSILFVVFDIDGVIVVIPFLSPLCCCPCRRPHP